MGFWDLFKPKGDTVSGTVEGIGKMAKDLSTALTQNIPPERRADILSEALGLQKEFLKAKAAIIIAEAQSNFLAASWRPITMYFFLVLIALDRFGVLARPLEPQVWALLQIGLGGYIVSRTGEKITANLRKGK